MNVFLQFPWVLNMEPYTTEGVARRESLNTTQQQIDMDSDNGTITDLDMAASNSSQQSDLPRRSASIAAPEIQYVLVGVIVHSGQANAGHYYSFIKDR